ncbi:hypothetical protein FQZ97_898900 [compost metagenome]
MDPTKPTAAAGSRACHGMLTRRAYCHVAAAVPHTEAPLFTPNSVAGWVAGNMANNAGTRMRPPPPTIESTKPANNEASETSSNSIPGLSPHAPAKKNRPSRVGLSNRASLEDAETRFCDWTGLSPRSPAVTSAVRLSECMHCSGLHQWCASGLSLGRENPWHSLCTGLGVVGIR